MFSLFFISEWLIFNDIDEKNKITQGYFNQATGGTESETFCSFKFQCL